MARLQQLAGQHLTLTNVALVLIGFLLAVLLHFNEHALGTRKRKDLYTVPGGHPLIGNLLSALSKNQGKRQMEWFSRERKRKDAMGDVRPMTMTVPGMRMIDITKRQSKWRFRKLTKELISILPLSITIPLLLLLESSS